MTELYLADQTVLRIKTTLKGSTLTTGYFQCYSKLYFRRLIHESMNVDFYLGELTTPVAPDLKHSVIAVHDRGNLFGETHTLKALIDDLYDQVLSQHTTKSALDYDGVILSMPFYSGNFMHGEKKFVLFNLEDGTMDEQLEFLMPERTREVSTADVIWLTERCLRVVEILHMYCMTFDDYFGPRYLVDWQSKRLLLVGFQGYRLQRAIYDHDVRSAFVELSQFINTIWRERPVSSETEYLTKFLKHLKNSQFSSANNARQALFGFFPELNNMEEGSKVPKK